MTSAVVTDAEEWPVHRRRRGGGLAGLSARRRRRPRRRRLAAPSITARPVATATLEDLFNGEHTTDSVGQVPPPKNKRRRRIGGWIALGVVLLLLGGIAGGRVCTSGTPTKTQIREVMGWEEPKDYEPGLANGEAFVTIASGDTGSPISQSAVRRGGDQDARGVLRLCSIDTGQNPPFVPGRLQAAEADDLRGGAGRAAGPGEQDGEHARSCAKGSPSISRCRCSPRAPASRSRTSRPRRPNLRPPFGVSPRAPALEGWLFPATYTFDPGVTAHDVIADPRRTAP